MNVASSVKALPVSASSCQTADNPIDHARRGMRTVHRAKEGKTIGMVCRPMARSPSVSLKSCEWMVVAKIPALMQIDNKAFLAFVD